MTISQKSTIGIFLLLFVVLYFGFDTKPKDHGQIEKSRALKMSTTDVSILKKEAKEVLTNVQKGKIDLINAQLASAPDTIQKIQFMKELSGAWYEFGFPSIAGNYAEKIAEVENTDDAWGIAATTYSIGIGRSRTEKESAFCKEKAMKAFDIAISLDSENIRHQINKAVTLADHPDADNPMKGILQLLDLNKSYPENVSVLNQLAKLGMKTNQWDKALERLKKALSLQPENITSNCLMAEVLLNSNQSADAEKYKIKCESLMKK